MITFAAIVLVSAGSAGIAVGKVIYVDGRASGADNGTSWADAYMFLQDGLADANESAKPVEVWVGQGIYQPDRSAAEPNGTGDRKATFQLINGVTLKGGYAGFGEPDPNARDIEAYETILSGELDGNDVGVNDPRDLLSEPTRADNSYHVVMGIGTDETAVLNGFTVTAGNAGGSYPNNYGGGMRNYGNPTLTSGSPTLTDCTFSGNSAARGGAMANSGSPTLTKCTFNGNSAGKGGAIYNSGSATLTNCTFNGNSAGRGGGMYNGWGPSTLANCTFSANTATYGGAIFCAEHSHPFVVNCILWGNNASDGPEIAMVGIDWGSWLSISYSDVQGGQAGVVCVPYDGYPDLCRLEWGPGNIDADPCFADSASSDYHLKSEGGRWDAVSGTWVQDNGTSPCIDAGDPSSRIGLESFPNGGVVNMGAYGGTAEGSKSYFGLAVCETVIAGDINGDCKVNFTDFAFMARHWLEDNNP